MRRTSLLVLASLLLGACKGSGEEDIRKANVFFKNTDLANAELHYRRAVEIAPENEVALEGLGNVYFERQDLARAIEWYEKAAKSAPRAMLPRHRLAIAKTELGDIDGAIRALEEALQIDRTNVFALNALGGLVQRKGDKKRAESLQIEALQHDEKHRGARLALASLMIDDGRYVEAERELARLQALGAKPMADYGFARLHARRGEFKEARARLEAVLHTELSHPRKILEDEVFRPLWSTPEGAALKVAIENVSSETSTIAD